MNRATDQIDKLKIFATGAELKAKIENRAIKINRGPWTPFGIYRKVYGEEGEAADKNGRPYWKKDGNDGGDGRPIYLYNKRGRISFMNLKYINVYMKFRKMGSGRYSNNDRL